MDTAAYSYPLPDRLIALRPAVQRDLSRLLVFDRNTGLITHQPHFIDIVPYFRPDDLLVLNNSRVIPARLRGQKVPTGGAIEVLLLHPAAPNLWWSLLRPGKRVRAGTTIRFGSPDSALEITAVVMEKNDEGHCCLKFSGIPDIVSVLDQLGEIPLPPYLDRPTEAMDRERYQTVFAQKDGSVAAPTAGLHFTDRLLADLKQVGLEIRTVTLHVGLGTFAPVKATDLCGHVMHEEHFELPPETAGAINAARDAGRRVIAVGTTTVRVLETVAANHDGRLKETVGTTRIFIYPPYRFRAVDGLLTNFHLPRSTLLMLVSAFAAPGESRGRDVMLKVYQEAVREEYRFFSYGDAMLIL